MASLVLLGAGASYGSVGVDPYPPPLGNQLFGELVNRGGVASSLPDGLKRLFEYNFEEGMAKYFEDSRKNVMTFQRELAEYLAEFKITEKSVYLRLINAVGRSRVIFSSLNYDLLFEQAALGLGYGVRYDSASLANEIPLLKIHGSCNFWPNFPMGMLRGCVMEDSGVADIEANIRPLDQYETLLRCRGEDSVAPAIALFAKGKAVRVCPSFVEFQYAQWKGVAEAASKIFIVGVRVHPVDAHIWEIIGKSKSAVYYFGFDSDESEFGAWKADHKKRNAYFINKNFEQAVPVIASLLNKR